jgi:hypothetical protein
MIAQGVLHGGALGQQTFAALGKRQILRNLPFALAWAKVKNFAESISLCTFAVIFRWDILLKKSYKPIIIN